MKSTIPDVSIVGANALVGMGQIGMIQGEERIKAVVGSCIGVSFYDPATRLALLGHIVLPDSKGKKGTPGKFADQAIPIMLDIAAQHGANPKRLIAKIAGGANMFNKKGPLQIGEANTKAVKDILAQQKIKVAGCCVGGIKGRRIELDCSTGRFQVGVVGQPLVTL